MIKAKQIWQSGKKEGKTTIKLKSENEKTAEKKKKLHYFKIQEKHRQKLKERKIESLS